MERLTPGPLRFTAGSDKHSGTRDRSEEMEDRDWLRRNHMPGLSSYTITGKGPPGSGGYCCLPPGPTCHRSAQCLPCS